MTLVNIQTNKAEDPFGWRVKVEKSNFGTFKNLQYNIKAEENFSRFFGLFS